MSPINWSRPARRIGWPIPGTRRCCSSPSRRGGRRRSEIAGLRVEQLTRRRRRRSIPPIPSLRAALPVDPAWPDQDHRGRRGRPGVSGWASGRGAAGMAIAGRHYQGAGVPGDRSMGRVWMKGADAAIGERDREAPDRLGRAGSEGVFRARAARRISDRGGAARGIGLPEAMQQSQHRSVQQAASYYNEGERRQGRAARLGRAATSAILHPAELRLGRELTSRPEVRKAWASQSLPAGNFS